MFLLDEVLNGPRQASSPLGVQVHREEQGLGRNIVTDPSI